MTRRPGPARTRSLLRWPATVLPALLLVATAGLAGGGSSPGSAPVVTITVTAAHPR